MPDVCVFCRPDLQPQRLFETDSLFVIPDKYPLQPGHTLIVSKRHVRCYGMAMTEVLQDLEHTAARLRPFLEEVYGSPVLTLENGIAGQTVFHAHLHLVPVRVPEISPRLLDHDDVTSVDGWEAVREYLATRGHYRYVELDGRRFVVAGYSPVLYELRRMLTRATGLTFVGHGWVKTTTQDDVRGVNQHWREWIEGSREVDARQLSR